MREVCSTFIKYPFLDQSANIWNFLNSGISIEFEKLGPIYIRPPRKVFEEHYAHIRQYTFFERMIDTFSREGIIFCAYFGEGIVPVIRRIVGPTDPSNAGPDTIRGTFSKDVLEIALAQNRAVDNVMHASGNNSEGEEEFDRFLPYLL